MLLAVAGLKQDEIARRTKNLAAGDWSEFAAHEQQAFQFAHQRPRGRGAPKKRTRAASRDLVSAVDGVRVEIAAKRNCQVDAVSLRDAINGLLKRKPNEWTGRQGKRLSLKSMETRYYQMRRRASAPIYDPFPAHK